jgi:hypothetical protein
LDGASSQPCLCAGRIASNAPTNLSTIEPYGPRLDKGDPVSKAQPPWCAAPAVVRQSLRVSRTPLCHRSATISITYARLNNSRRNLARPIPGPERRVGCLLAIPIPSRARANEVHRSPQPAARRRDSGIAPYHRDRFTAPMPARFWAWRLPMNRKVVPSLLRKVPG